MEVLNETSVEPEHESMLDATEHIKENALKLCGKRLVIIPVIEIDYEGNVN